MSLADNLLSSSKARVQQKKELAELLGVESRNKYEILGDKGQKIGFCAEQQKGVGGFFLRQIFGHWRKFDLYFFDPVGGLGMSAHHPFRWFFQALVVATGDGNPIGQLEQRFGVFTKKFDVQDASGMVKFRMRSALLSFWTFPFYAASGEVVAIVRKRWSGSMKELFTDADNFQVEFLSSKLTAEDRLLVLASAVFVDLGYFEKKA